MFGRAVTRTLAATSQQTDENRRNLAATVSALSNWIAASAIIVLVWCVAAQSETATSTFWLALWAWARRSLFTFGHAMIVASGAMAVGGLLGFLFGIPRTPPDSSASAGKEAADAGQPKVQTVNTNLEQISDWLTKILVGVGLTQFNALRGELSALGKYFAVADAPALTLALILNFAIVGFFCGYLLTRLFLAGAFVGVERSIQERATRAEQLQQVGRFEAASAEYESAVKQITPTTSPDEKRRIYEGLIFNALYEPPPEGFKRAIAYANQYVNDSSDAPSARIFAFLAAAYGQQFAFEKKGSATNRVLGAIRSSALEAAKRAFETDKGILELLRSMWDPNYPSKSPGDDDLEPFFDDPDFKALLGEK